MTSEKGNEKIHCLPQTKMKKITDSTVELNSCIEITGRWFQIVTHTEISVSYLLNTDIPGKKEMFINTRSLCLHR